jgi:hypothetical protein
MTHGTMPHWGQVGGEGGDHRGAPTGHAGLAACSPVEMTMVRQGRPEGQPPRAWPWFLQQGA